MREELVDLALERGGLVGEAGGGGDHVLRRRAGLVRGLEQPHQARGELLGLFRGVAAGARDFRGGGALFLDR